MTTGEQKAWPELYDEWIADVRTAGQKARAGQSIEADLERLRSRASEISPLDPSGRGVNTESLVMIAQIPDMRAARLARRR